MSGQKFGHQNSAGAWRNHPYVSCNGVSRIGHVTDNPRGQDQQFNCVANLETMSPVGFVNEGRFRCPESTNYMSACTTTPISIPFHGLDAASPSVITRCYSADDLSQIVNLACVSRLAGNIQNLGTMGSALLGKEDSMFPILTVQMPPENSHASFEESSIFPSRDLGDLNSVLKRFLFYNSKRSKQNEAQLHHSHGLPNKPEVNCPVARQAISSQLPPLHPTRSSAAPKNSTIFCSEITDAPQSSGIPTKGQFYLEHKILRTYTCYKRLNNSLANCHGSYINYFHSRICNTRNCVCGRVISIISHFDACDSVECKICSPFRDSCLASVSDQNVNCTNSFIEENREAYFSGSSFSLECESRTEEGLSPCSGISDGEVHPSKRMKLDNPLQPLASEDDSMSPVYTVKHQKFDSVLHLRPWAGSPVSTTSFEADCEQSENTKTDFSGINQVENTHGKLDSECGKVPSGELNIVYELEECSESFPLIAHDAAEPLIQSSSMLVSYEEPFDSTRELSIVGGCAVNAPEICGKLIKQNDQQSRGVSILECLTAKEVREHISSLGLSCRPMISKGEREDSMQDSDDNTWESLPALVENKCQLCKSDELLFAPPPIYCSSCNVRVKRNTTYYVTSHDTNMPHYICASCYRICKPRISFYGIILSKDKLEKKKNDDEIKEPWVQCDSCKQWQHQICSLYNSDRDMEGKAEYKCPKCHVKALESAESCPLPKAIFFNSQDLPRNKLSDFLEERLFRQLKVEQEERAKTLEKSPDEIPVAKELVVRVVSSDGKPLEVKQLFLDIFGRNYPAQFPQTSKVILLFQKIDGIDVCLFGLYVQEFGSDCRSPNKRSIYISYLDSVKYFRPVVPTTTGEALRTFVYHEILIGYLEYCKKRGFVSCHLWSCPSLKGEDFIFYCHPENQRTPKPEKLRQWYHSMLRKAAAENIVTHTTTLYDEFFIPTGRSSKITAARLPYFGGDYWCGTAEKVIKSFEQENGASCLGKVKNSMRKRTLKAMGHTDIADGAAKDALLMQELGQALLSAKEDFIVVHLQYMCSHCQEFILSGWRWSCSKCKYFQLCQTCHETEQNLRGESCHSFNGKEKHPLLKVLVDDVPSDTKDEDPISDNWLFSNRHTLLGVCQNRHYQFDTLRRAKYSSMMLLHHLGNSMMPVVPPCKVCLENSAQHGDVCAACFEKKKLLGVLLHASRCGPANGESCSDRKCRMMKRLFSHAFKCNIRAAGGCHYCLRVWSLLQLHSKTCNQEDCLVPRCKDMKARLVGVDCTAIRDH